jgi:hypothetical protein
MTKTKGRKTSLKPKHASMPHGDAYRVFIARPSDFRKGAPPSDGLALDAWILKVLKRSGVQVECRGREWAIHAPSRFQRVITAMRIGMDALEISARLPSVSFALNEFKGEDLPNPTGTEVYVEQGIDEITIYCAPERVVPLADALASSLTKGDLARSAP